MRVGGASSIVSSSNLACPALSSEVGAWRVGLAWGTCTYQGRTLGAGLGTEALQGRSERWHTPEVQRDLPPATVNAPVVTFLLTLMGHLGASYCVEPN